MLVFESYLLAIFKSFPLPPVSACMASNVSHISSLPLYGRILQNLEIAMVESLCGPLIALKDPVKLGGSGGGAPKGVATTEEGHGLAVIHAEFVMEELEGSSVVGVTGRKGDQLLSVRRRGAVFASVPEVEVRLSDVGTTFKCTIFAVAVIVVDADLDGDDAHQDVEVGPGHRRLLEETVVYFIQVSCGVQPGASISGTVKIDTAIATI